MSTSMRASIAVLLAILCAASPASAADPAERYSAYERRSYESSRVVVEEPYEEEVVVRRRLFVRELEPAGPHVYYRERGPRAGIVFDEPYGWAEDDDEAW
jgi:hypothetical protein